MSSEALLVKNFTEESTQNECPSSPHPMNQDEVRFLIKMVVSEMMELAQTVTDNDLEATRMLVEACINPKDLSKYERTDDRTKLISDQADAAIDSWYYILNAFCKKGINLSKVFPIVHQANLDKKDPKTGKYLRRDDGKIKKPEGWISPDQRIHQEIERQLTQGSW